MNDFLIKFIAFLQKDIKIALTYKFNILMQILIIILCCHYFSMHLIALMSQMKILILQINIMNFLKY